MQAQSQSVRVGPLIDPCVKFFGCGRDLGALDEGIHATGCIAFRRSLVGRICIGTRMVDLHCTLEDA